MAKKQKRKWSHFGTDNGKKFKTAKIDGYHFGDRLLEGVMFIITIQPDGTLKIEVEPSAKDYMSNLNEKKWLKEAKKYIDNNDIFESEQGDDCALYDTEGKLSYDNGQPPAQPIIIMKAKPFSAILGNAVKNAKSKDEERDALNKFFGTE